MSQGDKPNRLREVRKQKGMSQGDLSKKTGWSVQQISKWENGHIGLSLATAVKLAQALDVRVEELIVAS